MGLNLTEPIVEHFRKYDSSDSKYEEEKNILDLLGKSPWTCNLCDLRDTGKSGIGMFLRDF